jgi:hypothetical protein
MKPVINNKFRTLAALLPKLLPGELHEPEHKN